MKKVKINFDHLVGLYDKELAFHVLDWMLKTGKPHRQSAGKWCVIGVSQHLFAYSANDHDCEISVPPRTENWQDFFDAIFARAVHQKRVNIAIKQWREVENIVPGKSRYLNINTDNAGVPRDKYPYFTWIVRRLFDFVGNTLKKEYALPDFSERTEPKILSVQVYTTGNGWRVKYQFSFKEFDYEPGWNVTYKIEDSESLMSFFYRVIQDLENKITELKDEK